MSDSDSNSVSLLVVVAVVTLVLRIAWSSGCAVSFQPPATAPTPTATVIVTGDAVNLRDAPSTSAPVIVRAERGQELELVGTQEDWYNVLLGDGAVWISKLYASPTEDCAAEQPAAAEALRRQLPGEWKGEIEGRPATFIFYTRGERLCAYVLYLGVKEVLSVAAPSSDSLTLAGTRYERLAGATDEFWLDTFSGQLESTLDRLSGTFVDARGNRGSWFAAHSGAAAEATSISTGDEEMHLSEESSLSGEEEPEIERAADIGGSIGDVDESLATDPATEGPQAGVERDSGGEVAPTAHPLLGHWEGEGRQFNPSAEWRFEMDIASATVGAVVGGIRYPSLGCSGQLTLVNAGASKWTLREKISQGLRKCMTGGLITVVPLDADRAQWKWYYPEGALGAQAEITRNAE